MGTALTYQQVKIIRRLTDTVYISFDGDKAGKKAAISAGKELEKSSCDVKIVMLPNNMDPDEFISKHGVDAYMNQLTHAVSFHEFELTYLRELHDLSVESGKAKYLEEVVNVLKDVGTIERELQLNKLREEFKLPLHFFDQFFNPTRTNDNENRKSFVLPEPDNAYEVAERQLVAYMLNHSKAISLYEKKVTSMVSDEIWQLANFIYVTYMKSKKLPEISDWFTLMAEDEQLIRTLNSVLKDAEVTEDVEEYELEDYIKKINEYQFKVKAKKLEKVIETKPGTPEAKDALEQLGKLLQKTKNHI
jgi:DNA primase